MAAVEMRFVVIEDPADKIFALKKGMRNKILRKAVRAAARPVQQEAKSRAPKRTGSLKASLSVKIGTDKKKGLVYAVIGPRRRFQKKVKGGGKLTGITPTNYAHLVEFGTRPHSLVKGDKLARKGKGGGKQSPGGRQHPGTPATPFLEDAMQATGAMATEIMREVIAREIVVELGKKAASGR